MANWITQTVEMMGYPGVALLMFLENILPPIPSELIMPAAGFAAARGDLSLGATIVAGTIGSVLGQFPLYYLGRLFGEARLRRLADRYGRWLAVTGGDIENASRWFRRYGRWAVLLGRMIPGVRSYISIPAGLNGMNLATFTLYSAIGIGAWSAALAVAGYLLGNHYEAVSGVLGPASYAVLIGLMLALLIWVAYRYHCCLRRGR